MNWDQIKGKWTELKGQAQAKWGELTDDELDQIEGDKDQLVGIVQQKYGKSKEAAQEEVDSWSNNVS